MIHTGYLLLGLVGAWLLTGFAPRFFGGRSWRLFGLVSPLVLLGVVSVSVWVMALLGCMHFTPGDLMGSLTLSGVILATLGGSGLYRLGRSRLSRQKLHALSRPLPDPGINAMIQTLALQMALPVVPVRVIDHAHLTAVTTRDGIFVAEAVLRHLDPAELQAVLAHELAHLKRRDLGVALFATWMRDAFFYIPACRRLWQSLLDERETIADRLAARTTGQPLAMASALIKFRAAPERVSRLLEPEAPARSVRPLPLAFAYLGLWAIALVPLWSMWPGYVCYM